MTASRLDYGSDLLPSVKCHTEQTFITQQQLFKLTIITWRKAPTKRFHNRVDRWQKVQSSHVKIDDERLLAMCFVVDESQLPHNQTVLRRWFIIDVPWATNHVHDKYSSTSGRYVFENSVTDSVQWLLSHLLDQLRDFPKYKDMGDCNTVYWKKSWLIRIARGQPF